MEFLKKHYEKVVLSVVLLGLAVAAATLPIKVASVDQDVDSRLPRNRPKVFTPDDISTNISKLNRAMASESVRLGGYDHNLFNPVGWMESQGHLVKDPLYGRRGPDAVQIVQTTPLYLRIEYLPQGLKERSGTYSYTFQVTQEAAAKASQQRPTKWSLAERRRNKIFVLKVVRGAPEAPESFLIEFLAANREIEINAAQAFEEVAGYMADLYYEPLRRTFRKKRKNDTISIDRQEYKIVAIGEDEVVLSDSKTKKRTTIKAQPGG